MKDTLSQLFNNTGVSRQGMIMRVTLFLVLSLQPYYLTIVIFLPMIITNFHSRRRVEETPNFLKRILYNIARRTRKQG